LRNYAHATPSENKPKHSSSNVDFHLANSTVTSTKTTVQSLPSQVNKVNTFDIQELQAFCLSQNLHFDDHRDKGGAIWVRASENNESASTVLKSVGFQYKLGKGWWRE
jgi:hypothetical protein